MGTMKYYYDRKNNVIDIIDTEYSKGFNPTENQFEIDENIAYIIQELNLKGYKTMFCCEGHVENDDVLTLPYIVFENGIELPSCPDGWYVLIFNEWYNEDDNVLSGHWENIYPDKLSKLDDEKITKNDFYKEKFKALLNLSEWVEKLKDLTNKED